MRVLSLPPDYVQRLREFDAARRGEGLQQDKKAKSDYWDHESSLAGIEFRREAVALWGSSGFYIPPDAGTWAAKLRRLKRTAERRYKRLVIWLDRFIGLGNANYLSTLLTTEMAYDAVMQSERFAEIQTSPFRFNPGQLRPLFPSSHDLRCGWHLKDRYVVTEAICRAAFHYDMFAHFLPRDASMYLEIGAGSGNLASFFHHYRGMKAVIVDLPEVVLFSAAFLKHAFPEARVALPHELPTLTGTSLADFDFTFVLPSQIELIPDSVVDLAVNTFSMQEMTHAQIEAYIEFVQRVCVPGGLWCNENRIEKLPSPSAPPVRAFEYPYAPENEVLVWEVSRLMRLISTDGSVIRIERVVKS